MNKLALLLGVLFAKVSLSQFIGLDLPVTNQGFGNYQLNAGYLMNSKGLISNVQFKVAYGNYQLSGTPTEFIEGNIGLGRSYFLNTALPLKIDWVVLAGYYLAPTLTEDLEGVFAGAEIDFFYDFHKKNSFPVGYRYYPENGNSLHIFSVGLRFRPFIKSR